MMATGSTHRLWRRGSAAMLGGVGSAAILMLLSCLASPALADINAYNGEFGSVVLSGFVEQETDINTSNKRNPFIPDLGHPWTNLFLEWGLMDTSWQTPIEGLKFFARTRLFVNNTYNVNPTKYIHYDAFPQRWPGDGIAFMQLANNQVSLQGWEEWGQYESGNWFIRVGKQTIVWGDVSPARLLDQINPLDVTWHFVNEPLGRNVFDNLRVPIWAARASYSIPFLPPGFSIEGYISPDAFSFVPTEVGFQFPGSPYQLASVPPPLQYIDNVYSGRGGVSGGARLVGLLGPVNFSLVWLEGHDQDPVTQLTGVRGRLIPTPPYFIPTYIRINGQHMRYNTVGGSFNYFNDFTGVVVRGEASWNIGQPYQDLANSSNIIRRDRYGYVLAFDRPTFFVPWQHHSTSLTLMYEQLWFEGGAQPAAIGNAVIPRHEDQLTFLFEQPIEGFDWRGWNGRYDEWYLDFSILEMIQQATNIQPMIRFEPGDHWRYALYYTLYLGPNNTPPFPDTTIGGYGSLIYYDALTMSISYLF